MSESKITASDRLVSGALPDIPLRTTDQYALFKSQTAVRGIAKGMGTEGYSCIYSSHRVDATFAGLF